MLQTILVILAIAALGLLAIWCLLLILKPRMGVRAPFRILLPILYRRRVIGAENLPKECGYIVAANHVSWIDGILILWMMPRNVRFVVDGGNFDHPINRFLGNAFDTIFMKSGPKSIIKAMQTARDGLVAGDVIGIFPEGTLSRTGQLQGFRPGVQKIAKGTDAPIVPMYMEGMWGSLFSFSGGKFFWKWPTKWRRQLTLHISKPLPGDVSLHELRTEISRLSAAASIHARDQFPILPIEILKAWKRRGSKVQLADSMGNEVSGKQAILRAVILRRLLRREVLGKNQQHVSVLLPPSVGGVIVNVALAIDKRISANLNYTTTPEVLNYCNQAIGSETILSSEKFLEKTGLELEGNMVVLESLKDKVSLLDKISGALAGFVLPVGITARLLGLNRIQADDLLTVIFTSGSTGMPKGVQLSHANVSHNVEGINRAVRLGREDTVLGVLPFFHSFGYSVTLWAANTIGPRGVYHFNPLDARQVGKLAEKYRVTVLLATPTFLRSYLRRITAEQFAALDVVVVGAEKMPADLFNDFEQKFGVRPAEGYGATELSPLVSVNIPPSRSAAKFQPDRREGSVGRPVPGVCARVVSDDTGESVPAGEDGMLMVLGPNIMKGYVGQAEKTAEVLQDGWYVSGDIANVDADGFIHITGRLSRFSKIGGEMVPHIRIEEEINRILDDREKSDDEDLDGLEACVTAVPDEKKGERLIVLHLRTAKSIDEIRSGLQESGLPNLFIPSSDSFIEVDKIPLLGTGKLDLKGAKDLALEKTT
ncbi:MAG: AMP-binding protein [Planctomycetota bacterium]